MKKTKLYFSISSNYLFLILVQENHLLTELKVYNEQMHSENFFSLLQSQLDKNSISLKDIDSIFFTSKPGSQTSLRISLTFILTLQVLCPTIKIFHLDTLFFLSGGKDSIVLMNANRNKSSFHLSVFIKEEKVFSFLSAPYDQVLIVREKFPHLELIDKLDKIEVWENFKHLEKYFIRLDDPYSLLE